ncbi:MAG: aminotransferase class I/II-fold pyridoxal phosphate-dependent enzyme [Clostridium sp.]|nr:aminotransferase class I/II-fold pyridoxal phosphate-dependent enzyme [Clostridium sp.]
MYSFKNDYSEGAHERIMNALVKTNLEQSSGYGDDSYCREAADLLKNKIERDDVNIHLMVGGTQTNLTAISAFLRPHEACIAANTGHIFVHETGAIEATGHKVFPVTVNDGKLNTAHVQSVLDAHTDEHMVKPKLVYISNPTEIGTIYTKKELEDMYSFCQAHNLLLYVDGARLGCALTSKKNDMTMKDLAYNSDAFYVGGTKNGALFGEALVIVNDSLNEDFRYLIKQKGGLLAKGRLLGIQFAELFKDDLYFEIADHANKMAEILQNAIKELNYSFLIDSPTNQIFPIFPNKILEKLKEKYDYSFWEKADDNNSIIRLCTSWATIPEKVDEFIADLKKYTSEI